VLGKCSNTEWHPLPQQFILEASLSFPISSILTLSEHSVHHLEVACGLQKWNLHMLYSFSFNSDCPEVTKFGEHPLRQAKNYLYSS
jgi:hypothetical protein